MARIKVSVIISIFYRIVATFSSLDILIKDNCNVYYAVKSVNEIEFILRPKEMQLDNDVNNANNGYNHSNSNSSNSTAANIFQALMSPTKTKNQKFLEVPQSTTTTPLSRSSSTSSRRHNNADNSALPPQPPPQTYHHNSSQVERDKRANWQMFRKIMS